MNHRVHEREEKGRLDIGSYFRSTVISVGNVQHTLLERAEHYHNVEKLFCTQV